MVSHLAETLVLADSTDRLNTINGSRPNTSDMSRGIFGANVGTDRLLKLFDSHSIKASWYMPSHSIMTFPRQMAKVRDHGHEMYVSTSYRSLNADSIPEDCMAILTSLFLV